MRVPQHDNQAHTKAVGRKLYAAHLRGRHDISGHANHEKITQAIRLLAGARGGAVYHCAAGKDRTGVISAIVLGALGVDDELIVADYALSGAMPE